MNNQYGRKYVIVTRLLWYILKEIFFYIFKSQNHEIIYYHKSFIWYYNLWSQFIVYRYNNFTVCHTTYETRNYGLTVIQTNWDIANYGGYARSFDSTTSRTGTDQLTTSRVTFVVALFSKNPTSFFPLFLVRSFYRLSLFRFLSLLALLPASLNFPSSSFSFPLVYFLSQPPSCPLLLPFPLT